MPYQGSPSDIRLLVTLSASEWLTTANVLSLYNFLLSLNFSIVALRNEGLAMLSGVHASVPYIVNSSSPDTRFGSTPLSTYVTMSHPVWSRLIVQLASALSYKERQLEKGCLTDSILLAAADAQYLAQVSFSTALAEMSRLLWTGTGVFDRTSFEDQLSLTWV